MEKVDVVHFRELIDKCEFTLYKKTGEDKGTSKKFKPWIHICCDNSLNVIDDREGSVIWDDDNERFYWIRPNTPSTVPFSNSGMSFGSINEVPVALICVDYGEIQNIRCIMNKESFDNLYKALKQEGIMTEDHYNHLIQTLFDETDMKKIIARKKAYNYVTGYSNDTDEITNPSLGENQVYNKTIHPQSFGGV